LVERIPDALSFKNEEDQLPIQSAFWNTNDVKYIPIPAREGMNQTRNRRQRNARWIIGTDPEDKEDTTGNTLLKLIVNFPSCDIDAQEIYFLIEKGHQKPEPMAYLMLSRRKD